MERNKMKKKLLILIVVLLALSMIAIPTLAGEHHAASGTWWYRPSQPPEEKMAGGNLHMKIADEGYWEGTFDGLSTDYGFAIIHRAGHWTYKGWVLLDPVTVDGKTGSIEMRVNGSRPDMFSDWTGMWVIIGGTGELENLRGQGTWWGPGWQGDPDFYGEIPYAGNYHFAPDK
jgi:hypothetical protein